MSQSKANPIPALQALERHLQQQAEHGTTRVFLSPGAISDLNALQAAVAAAAPKPKILPAHPRSKPDPNSKLEPGPEKQAGTIPAVPAVDSSASSTIAETPQAPTDTPVEDAEKRAQLRDIAIRSKRCPETRALGSLRNKFVFAIGNPDADLMLVGEAPGMEEEKKHEPFVGPAGQLLDKIVAAMGLDRSQIYISNIVKFRPSTGDAQQGSRNRKPSAEEMSTSVSFVLEEIEVVQPKVVVALGGTAMEGLLGLEGSVASHRSQFHSLRGVPVMVTYHPSDLLRSGENREKRKVWEDLLLVMQELGLPISPKQRSYFL